MPYGGSRVNALHLPRGPVRVPPKSSPYLAGPQNPIRFVQFWVDAGRVPVLSAPSGIPLKSCQTLGVYIAYAGCSDWTRFDRRTGRQSGRCSAPSRLNVGAGGVDDQIAFQTLPDHAADQLRVEVRVARVRNESARHQPDPGLTSFYGAPPSGALFLRLQVAPWRNASRSPCWSSFFLAAMAMPPPRGRRRGHAEAGQELGLGGTQRVRSRLPVP